MAGTSSPSIGSLGSTVTLKLLVVGPTRDLVRRRRLGGVQRIGDLHFLRPGQGGQLEDSLGSDRHRPEVLKIADVAGLRRRIADQDPRDSRAAVLR